MATLAQLVRRPPPDADPAQTLRVRSVAIAVGLLGVAAVAAALFVNVLVATGDAGADNLFWTFGLSVAGFGTLKLAIALVLTGIIVRLWMRVDAVNATLPSLKRTQHPRRTFGTGTSRRPSAAER